MWAWSVAALAAASIPEVILVYPRAAMRIAGDDGSSVVVSEVRAAGMDLDVIDGGATRSESVRNGLAALSAEVDRVVVHDAARPLVAPELFARCLAELEAGADAAIAAARVTDTIKEADADRVVTRTHDRSRLWAIQTPQAFRREALERALAQPDEVLRAATDDAMLVETQGGRVVVVEAPPANFKVTTPHDLEVAELLLGRR